MVSLQASHKMSLSLQRGIMTTRGVSTHSNGVESGPSHGVLRLTFETEGPEWVFLKLQELGCRDMFRPLTAGPFPLLRSLYVTIQKDD